MEVKGKTFRVVNDRHGKRGEENWQNMIYKATGTVRASNGSLYIEGYPVSFPTPEKEEEAKKSDANIELRGEWGLWMFRPDEVEEVK